MLAGQTAGIDDGPGGGADEAVDTVAVTRVRAPAVDSALELEGLTDRAAFEQRLELAGYVRVSGFIQRAPQDGSPAEYPTDAFLGYDRRALHVVFLADDPDPRAVRARMIPRENIGGDDWVTLMLDTDADRRRAYAFRANPRGIQWDALYTDAQGYDVSFDAVWSSEGWVTDWGYAVRMEIPFISLRFDPREDQLWRIVLQRQLARGTGEDTYWPQVSASVEGILTQSAEL
jgi:hypothetical protein